MYTHIQVNIENVVSINIYLIYKSKYGILYYMTMITSNYTYQNIKLSSSNIAYSYIYCVYLIA